MRAIDRDAQPYTPLFCEENIWHLARHMLTAGYAPSTLHVLFLSNAHQQLVMFNQQRAAGRGYVVWDYHVVLQSGEQVYDFDTSLSFPVDARQYFLFSFPSQSALAQRYRGQLRRIPAVAYVERFHSDRSHMQGVVAQTAFPEWAPIMGQGEGAITLDAYRDMGQRLDDGSEVMTVAEYLQRLEAQGS